MFLSVLGTCTYLGEEECHTSQELAKGPGKTKLLLSVEETRYKMTEICDFQSSD